MTSTSASSGYTGSKAQAAARIIGQMPPHDLYVEAFFGSGQIFWRKRRAAGSVIIDVDPELLAKAGAETGVNAICGDAISILPKLTLGPGTLVYCDPPYLLSTRKGRRYYKHELTDREHKSLLTLLEAMDCRVMISGYPSELYSSHLQRWRCLSYRVRVHGATRTECLWMNFQEPALLHDWRFGGRSYRERLTFKRLAARWINRLERMPARKRGFLIHSLQHSQIWR